MCNHDQIVSGFDRIVYGRIRLQFILFSRFNCHDNCIMPLLDKFQYINKLLSNKTFPEFLPYRVRFQIYY